MKLASNRENNFVVYILGMILFLSFFPKNTNSERSMRPQQGLLRSLALYPFWRLEDWDLTTKTIFTHGSFAMSIKQKLKPIKVQEIEIKFAQNWNWTEHSSTGEHRKYKMRGFLVPKRHILAKRAQFPIIFRSNQISSCPQHSCFWLPSAYPLEVLVWVCVCVCVCVCV